MDEDDGHYNPMVRRLRRQQKLGAAYKHAPKQERKLAARTQAWRTPGSGNGKQKGDVRVKDIARIECKSTAKKSFSITREMLDKIEAAAGLTGEIPIVQVDFVTERGKITDSVAVVPMWVIEKLIRDASNT